MKNLLFISWCVFLPILYWSCDTDHYGTDDTGIFNPSPVPTPTDNPSPEPIPDDNPSAAANVYFGFLDGDGSSDTFIDMPVDSSPEHMFIGRWQIVKLGVDESDDGNIKYYNYENFEHNDCGDSFLQFNNDGIVFENSYYKDNGECRLYSEIDNWELIEQNRFKIYVYDIIYLVKVTESELVLKYDWKFENSLYAPMQVYYYYEREQPQK